MFREIKYSNIDPKVVGVGSIVRAGNDKYLIISSIKDVVSLMSLSSFKILPSATTVADVNYLTKEEVKDLLDGSTDYTFSDWDFDPAGIKKNV